MTEIIVEFLRPEIGIAVPSVYIVINGNPGEKIGYKVCAAVYLARADVRSLIERIGKVERYAQALTGAERSDPDGHIRSICRPPSAFDRLFGRSLAIDSQISHGDAIGNILRPDGHHPLGALLVQVGI